MVGPEANWADAPKYGSKHVTGPFGQIIPDQSPISPGTIRRRKHGAHTSPAESMARISSPRPSVATHPGASSFDLSSTELGQLLARLQLTVLHADPEREQRLRHSEFERAKLEAVGTAEPIYTSAGNSLC